MAVVDPGTQKLINKILSNTDEFPPEFTSWIKRQFTGPANIMTMDNIPFLEGRKINVHEADTPPVSPAVGDLWLNHPATGSGSFTTTWVFRYEPDMDATNPWQYFSGMPLHIRIDTSQDSNTHGAWHDLATVGPSWTVTRTGIYKLEWGFTGTTDGAGWKNYHMGPAIGGTSPFGPWCAGHAHSGAGHTSPTGVTTASLTQANDLRFRYFTSDINAVGTGPNDMYQWRWANITPQRVQ